MQGLRFKFERAVGIDVDPDGPGAEEGIFGLPTTAEQASVHLIPVPWEVTTSYGRGTMHGPAAIAEASVQVDLYDPELAAFGLAEPWAWGIHLATFDPELANLHGELCALACASVGAGEGADPAWLQRVNQGCDDLQKWVYQQVSRRLDQGKMVGIVGGDHSVPLGAMVAIGERCPNWGILHIDAHADLRVAYEGFTHSHASIMDNALREVSGLTKLVQVGIRDLCRAEASRIATDPRVTTFFAHDLHGRLSEGECWSALSRRIVAELPTDVYISLDIDGLDPPYCPHTGTPVPGGLAYEHLTHLLVELLRQGRRVLGFDLVEVAVPPRYPEPGWNEWDANVGARLLMKLCAVALASQGARD